MIHEGQSWWTSQCDGSESPWVISISEDNSNYFGLCNQNGSEQTLFAKKMKDNGDNSEKLVFKVCDQSCWKTTEERDKMKILQQVNDQNWNLVKFRLKNP